MVTRQWRKFTSKPMSHVGTFGFSEKHLIWYEFQNAYWNRRQVLSEWIPLWLSVAYKSGIGPQYVKNRMPLPWIQTTWVNRRITRLEIHIHNSVTTIIIAWEQELFDSFRSWILMYYCILSSHPDTNDYPHSVEEGSESQRRNGFPIAWDS